MEITKEVINTLFSKCFFDDDEIVNGRPTSDYVAVSSPIIPKDPIAFSANHLQAIKKDILSLIDSIPNIEDGVSIEILRKYEWGNDDYLNKLTLMGNAISALNITSIDIDDEKIFYIKRDKSHDLEEINGLPKENIPEVKNEVKKAYTKEEQELIRQNGERITKELNDYLQTINRGLNFFGIKAKLDESTRNKLDFYDQDNNLLYERVFLDTDGIIGIEGMFNQRLKCEFNDSEGNEITYLYDNRHIFILSSPKDKKYGYRIELTGKEENYKEISISTVNPLDEYTIKSLEITDEYLSMKLENAFGPYGNYVDGTTRKINYHSPLHSKPYFSLIETVWPHEGAYLYCDEGGFKFFREDPIVEYENRDQFNRLATNLVVHPRNREAINYTLDEFERVFPGIKEFTINNSGLLKYLLEVPYIDDPIMDIIMNKAINHACDFKEKAISKKQN